MGQLSDYLAEALKAGRDTMDLTLEGVSPEQMQMSPGGTANPISSIYVHAVRDEDDLISMIVGQPSLWATGWKEKVGGTDEIGLELNDAAKAFKLDRGTFTPYAAAVAEKSERIIRGLSDEDLEKTLDFGEMGQPSAKEVIRDYVTWHYGFHGGEISSQKGVMGLKGVPF